MAGHDAESGSGSDAPTPGLWGPPAPGKLIGRGHGVGDFLEAHEWDVLENRDGVLRVLAHLPAQVKNPRGQLFGGFTPTYVDFMAIHTYWAGRVPRPGHPWLATLNMRVDYFAPIVGERFEMSSRVVNRGGSTCWIETRFLEPAPGSPSRETIPPAGPEGVRPDADPGHAEPGQQMLAWAYTTLKAV